MNHFSAGFGDEKKDACYAALEILEPIKIWWEEMIFFAFIFQFGKIISSNINQSEYNYIFIEMLQ